MNAILNWMQDTWLSSFVVGYSWVWPTLEILHFSGMCLLFGAILIMDLRLLGFQKLVTADAVHQLVPFAILGFVINLTTGIMFLFGDPFRYAVNISFQIKMVLVLLAGLNALLYSVKVEPMMRASGPDGEYPYLAKTVGLGSIVLWTGVISFGRLIPYLGTG